MKTRIILALLAITLAACTPAQLNADIQNTAVVIAQTGVALTQTALPTDTLPPSTFTSTATLEYLMPTLLPTLPPPPIFTPDAIQVERWKEYETALVQSMLPTFSSESILCEWDILARADQEVYVWAVCASPNVSDWRPAVIHLGADGSVQSVKIPKRGSSSDINRMFPEEAQTKFSLYTGDSLFNRRLKEMIDHLNYRVIHPEEPPLIVLSATPTATPTP